MKRLTKPRVVNQFDAITTTFRSEFGRKQVPKRNFNLRMTTILSNNVSFGDGQWLESILEIWHQGAIVIDESGKVIQTTEITDQMLAKYFPQSEHQTYEIPIVLKTWVESIDTSEFLDDVTVAGDPYTVDIDGDELRIQLIVDSNTNHSTLLLKETLQVRPKSLMQLGLTKRESEVLFLIAKGKTNSVIGTLLQISMRTVQKHVEHIYVKLGIETRTAAMLRVQELGLDITPSISD